MTLLPVHIKQWHVFLSSPGDMESERQVVRKFFDEYNRHTARHWGVRFEVVDWENCVTIGIGRPQELITRQTLDKYYPSLALFIGLMGQRFGSPTGVANSGTEEEFNCVLQYYRETEFPEIKMFFRRVKSFVAPPNPEKIQEACEQWKKVREFYERIKAEYTLLYKEFDDLESFADVLPMDLSLWLADPNRPWFQPPFVYNAPDAPHVVPPSVVPDKEKGLIYAAITRELGKQTDKVSEDDYGKVERLSLDGAEISNLVLIGKLVNLQYLVLNNTQVSDLQPIQGLSKLRKLYLSGTQVSDLKPIKELANLQLLALNNSQVSDLEPIKSLTNLLEVYLSGTQVSDLDPINDWNQLQVLALNKTEVSDLEPIKGWTLLRKLYLSDTGISNLTPLKQLTRLRLLGLNNTQISNLRPIKTLVNLRELYLSGSKISDVGPIKHLKNLQLLGITNTQVRSLEPISGLTNLRSLFFSSTEVNNLVSISGLTNLQVLSLRHTKVSDLEPIKSLTNLTNLKLVQTKVHDLEPIKTLINLNELHIAGTPVSNEQVKSLQQALPNLKIYC